MITFFASVDSSFLKFWWHQGGQCEDSLCRGWSWAQACGWSSLFLPGKQLLHLAAEPLGAGCRHASHQASVLRLGRLQPPSLALLLPSLGGRRCHTSTSSWALTLLSWMSAETGVISSKPKESRTAHEREETGPLRPHAVQGWRCLPSIRGMGNKKGKWETSAKRQETCSGGKREKLSKD